MKARLAADLPSDSAFASLAEASGFFRTAPLGYSATQDVDRLDGVELSCPFWRVAPLLVESVESSFFDDRAIFPSGVVELDSALLMRDIPASWYGHAPLQVATKKAA